MIKLSEIERKYLELVDGEFSIQQFEEWLYKNEEIIAMQSGREVYDELIQINYKSTEAKHNLSKTIEVNYDKLFRFRIQTILSKILDQQELNIRNVKYQMLFDLHKPSFSFKIGELNFLMNSPFEFDQLNQDDKGKIEDDFANSFKEERLFLTVIIEALETDRIRVWHPKLTEQMDTMTETKLMKSKKDELQIIIENNYTFIDNEYLKSKMEKAWL